MTDKEVESICDIINNGFKIMVVMRGLPGSGKSTLADTIVKKTLPTFNSRIFVFSTDHFFMKNGKYLYDKHRLQEAHAWNQDQVRKRVNEGLSPIIVDNTNIEYWEMRPYLLYAVNAGYIVELLEPKTPWARQVNGLANRTLHNVPKEKLRLMCEKIKMNPTVSGIEALNLLGLTYPNGKSPPVLRNKPPISIDQRSKIQAKPKPNLMNGISPKIQNLKRSPQMKVQDNCVDLITFDDAEAPAAPENNSPDDNWSDWEVVESKKPDLNPKPQRPKINANWQPIDDLMTLWNTPSTSRACPMTESIRVQFHDVSTSTSDFPTVSDKSLDTFNRDINLNYTSIPDFHISARITLDKGTMTIDENDLIEKPEKVEAFKQLSEMFIDIPKDTIKDLLQKCKGDINWATELLLETKRDGIVANNYGNDDEITFDYPEDIEEIQPKPKSPEIEAKPKTVKKDKSMSDISLQLKKEIEQNFKFGDDKYSEYCLKLKRRLHGEETPPEEVAGPSNAGLDTTISTESTDLDDGSPSDDKVVNDPIVQFNLGHEFIQQLDSIYGTCYMADPTLEPLINLPMSLVNQIHALWLESICNKKEHTHNMMLNDEEFVRQLEQLEHQQANELHEVSSLQEILDMELALAYYHADLAKSSEQEEDLATKLTRHKLIEMFPDIDKDILLDIYEVHNRNFNETFQSLLLSTGRLTESQMTDVSKNVLRTLMAEQEQMLIEKAKREREKISIDCTNDESLKDDTPDDQEIDHHSFVQYYREEAQRHLETRNKFHLKAQECKDTGKFSAASYYSHVAALHMQKHEMSNNLAINHLMQLSAEKNNYTLDLHHMYVPESLRVLDVFIDNHINNLRQLPTESCMQIHTATVFIITGRGRHSPNNKPRIKPAVIKRLNERSLIMKEVNPGLLSVNLSSLNRMSGDLDTRM